MNATDAFTYPRDTEPGDVDIIGYDVEAEDAHLGKVDDASAVVGDSYVVVDTGFWIFGKKRMIPASRIRQINHDSEKVFVTLAKGQVEHAPDYDPALTADPVYRDELIAHYTAVYR